LLKRKKKSFIIGLVENRDKRRISKAASTSSLQTSQVAAQQPSKMAVKV
jgi:hypothetical protein